MIEKLAKVFIVTFGTIVIGCFAVMMLVVTFDFVRMILRTP